MAEAMDEDLKKLLADVEASHQQLVDALSDQPEQVGRLKHSVCFLLDVLSQVHAASAQQETLLVLQRMVKSCLAYAYDRRVFQADQDEPASAESNTVLKALLVTVAALASTPEIQVETLQAVIACAKAICVNSMTTADALMLFEFLRVEQPAARRLILHMQKSLVEAETIPRAIFVMKGEHAGIVAPSTQVVFTKKGYTFSVGLLLETTAPRVSIYSFRGNNGQGASLVLDGEKLILKTHAGQGVVYQVVIPFGPWREIMMESWVHLCVVHAKKMVFKDKLMVYANGKMIFNGNLAYPDPLAMIGGQNCIGIVSSVLTFQGKMWSPTLFGQPLSDAEVQKLHWLTHWKNDLSFVAAENTALVDKSKFIFSYDARNCDPENRTCFDVSGNDCHGWIEPGTNPYLTQGFVQALDSIGGSASFLLLLLDQIPEMAEFHPKYEFANDEISDLIAFLAECLQCSIGCRSHFIRLQGVKVLAFILQSISPTYLSLSILDSVTIVLESLLKSLDRDVAYECITVLLFFNTSWFLSPYETQVKLLGIVLPKYLKQLQDSKHHAPRNPPSSNSNSGSVQTDSNVASLVEGKQEFDVSFFCNLLVQLYLTRACIDGEGMNTGQMNEEQLHVLRRLIIENLIGQLLFSSAPGSEDQWTQLFGHICQRCASAVSSGSHEAEHDRVDVKELLVYLTSILSADSQPSALSQALPTRQVMVSKITKLSAGTFRVLWRPVCSPSMRVRMEGLRLLEAYTSDKIVLRKKDMYMLYSSLQPYALTMPAAELLLDIAIGRKHVAYYGTSGNASSSSTSGRSVNIARLEYVPLLLLGLLQDADFTVQARVLFEIKTQLSSAIVGETVTESIRSWPQWLGHLRSMSIGASQVKSVPDMDPDAGMESSQLNDICILLSDNTSAISSRLDAIQAITEARDVRGCDFVLSIFQSSLQPASITKAIAAMVNEHFPQRCHVLVSSIANHMIVDIVVYSILYVQSGWMHFLEFYFYHYRYPADLCSLTVAICEKVLRRLSEKSSSPSSDMAVTWQNLSQVATIVSIASYVADEMKVRLNLENVTLSQGQERIFARKAFELWSVMCPHLHYINWEELSSSLAQSADYGEDVKFEEKEIFCLLVAIAPGISLISLQTVVQYVTSDQIMTEPQNHLIRNFRSILETMQIVPKPVKPVERSRSISLTSMTMSAHRLVTAQPPSLPSSPPPSFGNELSLHEPLGSTQTNEGHSEQLHEGTIQLYALDACFIVLRNEIALSNDFMSAFSIVEIMVRLASAASQLESMTIHPELAKTLQIMSSTDLTFFHELPQLQELLTLWELHRELHEHCCDQVIVQKCVKNQCEPFLRRWVNFIEQHTLHFNPFLVQKSASSVAEILSHELQCCEDLWNQILEQNAVAAVLASENEIESESRLSSLKQHAEKFAGSVHKLIRHADTGREPVSVGTTDNADTMSDAAQSTANKDCEDSSTDAYSNTPDGFVFKIHSRENGFRMRLRLKKVRDNYRLRNLSYEYAGSSFQDTESRGSGHFPPRRFHNSQDGGLFDMDRSWRSDTGSDYSDFLADAQMRAALIKSCTNADEQEDDLYDEDDLEEEEEANYYDPDDEAELPPAESQQIANLELDQLPPVHLTVPPISVPSDAEFKEASTVGVDAGKPSSTKSVSSPPSRMYSSIGASMLSVVGGVAGIVQRAAKDAKDVMEFGVDSLYTTKDALADETQVLMQEVSAYIDETSSKMTESTSPVLTSTSSSGSVNTMTSPVIAPHEERPPTSGPVLFPPSAPGEAQLLLNEKPQHRGSKKRSTTPVAKAKNDIRIDAKLVRHMHVVDGKMIVTDSGLYFIAERVIDEHGTVIVEKKRGLPIPKVWRFLFKRRHWKVDDIASINRRRYLLKPTALEIFIHSTRKNYFFNFAGDDLIMLHDALMARRPLLLKRDPAMRRLRHPSSIFRNSSMSIRWVNHEISTFEYLMWLNTIAGRTYNDLTQYPVFPWVIADYESSVLDLSRRSTFRDLSKPMGALQPSRLKFFLDRYHAFEDQDIPKFMYGTHYSNIGAVLYYFIRLEPYTSYALSVQGGKFDHADRLFHCIAETWNNCLNDFTDLKELTPEWFYLPEFLVNCNKLDLGCKQNGVQLGDVILPPWARSPEDFVMKNFVALESDYVSENIHLWIDLVFGWKQRGQAAVTANNVFFYLTYEGMVDIDSITDPVMKSSMRAQIAHFGQTPSQVLRDPHPQRHFKWQSGRSADDYGSKTAWHSEERLRSGSGATLEFDSSGSASAVLNVPHDDPILFIQFIPGTSLFVCIDSIGTSSSHRYGGKSAKVHHTPFLNDLSVTATRASGVFKTAAASAVAGSGAQTVGGGMLEPPSDYIELQDRKSRKILSEKRLLLTKRGMTNTVAFLNGGSVFCTVGHHDFSARFYSASDGTLLYRLLQHNSIVTCLDASQLGSMLVLGSTDGTLSVWKLANINSTLLDSIKLFRGSKTATRPVQANDYSADQVLLGHSAKVNCVTISEELGVCISGSSSNECLAHNLDDGSIVCQYEVSGKLAPGVISLTLSRVGHLALQSLGTGEPMLYTFHLNGTLMAKVCLGESPMLSLSVCSRYSKVVVSNNEQAVMYTAHTLEDKEVLLEKKTHGEITSQALSPDGIHVIFGVGNGRLAVHPLLSTSPPSMKTNTEM